MKAKNYFRLALLLEDNNATTFATKLQKMISLVIFDGYNKNGMNVYSIIRNLKNKYSLSFADNEVIEALSMRKERSGIFVLKDNTDPLDKIYQITQEKYESIKKKIDCPMLTNIVERFVNENNIKISSKNFENILLKFMYGVFNSNVNTMLALLGNKKEDLVANIDEYSLEEKQLINSFLFWDDNNKNKNFFSLLSCCFDYCMMTVGSDESSFKNILKNKRFFLDTNVIFRMAGLNNQNRKEVIDGFIEKCKLLGIELCYTNQTEKELKETIAHKVNKIREKLEGTEPVSIEAYSILESDNLDFYEYYYDWFKENESIYNDYERFKNDLEKRVYSYLNDFNCVPFEDYEKQKNNEDYLGIYESLLDYKNKHKVVINEDAVKIDAKNYLFIKNLNEKVKSQDVSSIQNYIISTDHLFCDWCRTNRPYAIPYVVLPSVWYSMMLKYSGRTDIEDYNAFVKFINFSYNNEDDNKDEKKSEILSKVLHLKESTEIKNEIIFDIKNKLENDYSEMKIEEIVSESQKYVTDEKIKEVEHRKDEELKKQLSELKEENKRFINSYIEENREKLTEVQEKIEKQINRIASRNTNRKFCLYVVITIIVSFAYIIGVLYGVANLNIVNEKLGVEKLDSGIVVFVMTLVSSIFAYLAKKLVIETVFKDFNKDKIYKIERKKIEDEFNRIK